VGPSGYKREVWVKTFVSFNFFQFLSGSYLKLPVALNKARAANHTKYIKGGEAFEMLLII
jgi:hypothetical protein